MKGTRTLLYATAVLTLGILQSTELHTYLQTIHADGNGPLTTAIGIGILILRFVTTTAIFNPNGDDK